jgi:geranylgeranyl pyrophosphate synthase
MAQAVRLGEKAPFEQVLDAAGAPVRALMAEAERRLSEAADAFGPELGAPAESTLAAGGKRLRPLLVFVCGRAGASDDSAAEPLVRAACAVELVHMATLLHDDVIDGALVRRGRPTVFASSGRDVATATGDFLFSRAFSLLAASADDEQVRVLSEACLSLARGELVQRRDAYARGVDVERYLHRCELKTASLFGAACRLGALASGNGAQADALARFGRQLGLAFQILDDVIDVAGSEEQTGKQRGTDLLEGTTTLPLILAAETDPELRDLDLAELRTRKDAERICDRVAAGDALDRSKAQARVMAAAAKAELDGNVDPATYELLTLVSDRIVDRQA